MKTRRVHYLDYNATTPIRPAVIEAMSQALARHGNPSSVHGEGRRAKAMLATARRQVAALVGVRDENVIFTSGGTEANRLALAQAAGRAIIVSAIEHDSILAPAASLVGDHLVHLRVDADGRVAEETLEEALAQSGPAFVSIMRANNETGVLQPISHLAAVIHRHGGICHSDASQAAGKIDIDFAALGVDYLTLSAHKIGGPPGVGALIVRDGHSVEPLLTGGGQEYNRRAGTENLAGIVGFGVAAEAALDGIGDFAHLAALCDHIEQAIAAIAPDAEFAGQGVDRLPNSSMIRMPGVKGETQVMALDLAGVCVSSGAACSSGKVTPSHVLEAMGFEATAADEAIRISLGWNSNDEDAAALLAAWSALYRRTRRGTAA